MEVQGGGGGVGIFGRGVERGKGFVVGVVVIGSWYEGGGGLKGKGEVFFFHDFQVLFNNFFFTF